MKDYPIRRTYNKSTFTPLSFISIKLEVRHPFTKQLQSLFRHTMYIKIVMSIQISSFVATNEQYENSPWFTIFNLYFWIPLLVNWVVNTTRARRTMTARPGKSIILKNVCQPACTARFLFILLFTLVTSFYIRALILDGRHTQQALKSW